MAKLRQIDCAQIDDDQTFDLYSIELTGDVLEKFEE